MPATMSLLGLYNWDRTILDGLRAPDGVDKSALVNNLLRECAELEILYPHPDALKFFVSEWSKERFPVWNKLAATLNFEYDPISNYDRREEWTDERSGSSEDSTEDTFDNETENLTAGYNSAEANVPEAKGNTSGSVNSNTNRSVREENKRTGRAYGNIGVTTTQQMIEQERRIVDFDIDHVIIQEFKKTFCLLVY